MLQQLRNPDTVLHVCLAPRDLLDVRGVHEQTGEVALERVEHRLPEHARALHRDVRHAVRGQPVVQHEQLSDRGAECLHVLLRLPGPSAQAHAGGNAVLVHVESAAALELSFHGPPPVSRAAVRRSLRLTIVLGVLNGNNAGCRTLPRHTQSRTPRYQVAATSPGRRQREGSPFSCCEGEPLAHDHSITWSARPSTDGGIVSPNALAVLRLTANSSLAGCSIGRSPGLAPFKILSTKVAACRNTLGKLAPYAMRPPASTSSLDQYMAGSRFFAASSMIRLC